MVFNTHAPAHPRAYCCCCWSPSERRRRCTTRHQHASVSETGDDSEVRMLRHILYCSLGLHGCCTMTSMSLLGGADPVRHSLSNRPTVAGLAKITLRKTNISRNTVLLHAVYVLSKQWRPGPTPITLASSFVDLRSTDSEGMDVDTLHTGSLTPVPNYKALARYRADCFSKYPGRLRPP